MAHVCVLRGPWQTAPPAVGQTQGPLHAPATVVAGNIRLFSRAWSYSAELTEEQREKCRREAAKRRSRRRLGQSGPLTGQNDFVGRNCATGRREGEKVEGRRKKESRRQEKPAVSQVRQGQRFTEATWERCQSNAQVKRRQSRQDRRGAREAGGRIANSLWQIAKGGRCAGQVEAGNGTSQVSNRRGLREPHGSAKRAS